MTLTPLRIFIVGVVAGLVAASFVWLAHSDDLAMQRCQERHSFGVCFNTIYR